MTPLRLIEFWRFCSKTVGTQVDM